jgi:hypothetical protein
MSLAELARLARPTLYNALVRAGGDGMSPLELMTTIYPYVTQANFESYPFEFDVIQEVINYYETRGDTYTLEVEPPETYRFYAADRATRQRRRRRR